MANIINKIEMTKKLIAKNTIKASKILT